MKRLATFVHMVWAEELLSMIRDITWGDDEE
jgi:hypothetical protein